MAPDPIDLLHENAERVIGVYLLETADGPALFDCGPSPRIGTLKEGLRARGLELEDLRHLLLSHIHLDHAGAAGVLVREHPALQVHVSEIGAPHLVDPARLEASARRLYGDTFDALWGELAPVPQENIRVAGDRVLGLECFPSPGHASHHVCYLGEEGTLYAGDAAGVRIQPHSTVLPPTPPPEFDLDVWQRTLDEIERRDPTRHPESRATRARCDADPARSRRRTPRAIRHRRTRRPRRGPRSATGVAALRFRRTGHLPKSGGRSR